MCMNNKPAVSVIVPMYNTENYLRCCVDSLLSQTLKNIEIILVNDESPDNCGKIAETYAKEDSRVKVVHRKNGGLGPARNSGIEVATGEFVGFVDSDDWVEKDMYERLYSVANDSGAQIVFSNLKRVVHGCTQEWQNHPFSERVLRGENEIFELRRSFYGALPSKLIDSPVAVSVCPCLYSRKLIVDSGVKFRAIRSEDIFFNIDVCRAAKCVTAMSGAPYCYRKDDQSSITSSFKTTTVDAFFDFFIALLDKCDEEPEPFYKECLSRTYRRIIDYTRGLFILIAASTMSENEKKDISKEMLNRSIFKIACEGFPFWRLPAKQMVFFLCMKHQWMNLALFLAKTRGK